MRASHGTCMQASRLPLYKCGVPEITYGHLCVPAEQYLSKLTSSHFSTLNTKIANWNMLKRILIAMHNENEADCNENLRLCAEEPIAPLYNQ